LASIDYQLSSPNFSNLKWSALSAVQIACIIYVLVLALIGFLLFCCPGTCFAVIYAIILFISFLFVAAIGILALIASQTGWLDTNFGCSASYTVVLDVWNGVDAYLNEVDQGLCSNGCSCLITNSTGYTSNSTIKTEYDRWDKSTTVGAIAFPNCTSQLRDSALSQARTDPTFSSVSNFNDTAFASYMAILENKFQCTGFCKTNYKNANYNANVDMVKYLFTDINRGPPLNTGCLTQFINWVPNYLKVWGSLAIAIAGLQLILFIVTICICYMK